MSPLQIAILEMIEANDEKFSWYQLDGALTHQVGVHPGIVSMDLMTALRDIEQAGYITASAGDNPAQPLYSVTPTGQEQLEVQRASLAPTSPLPVVPSANRITAFSPSRPRANERTNVGSGPPAWRRRGKWCHIADRQYELTPFLFDT